MTLLLTKFFVIIIKQTFFVRSTAQGGRRQFMKEKIHPNYQRCTVTCISCGATFETGSTLKEIKVDTCSNCHPFYTGKQRFVQSDGRVAKFNRKYGLEDKK
jgi:large subunit ribosomal protein L31